MQEVLDNKRYSVQKVDNKTNRFTVSQCYQTINIKSPEDFELLEKALKYYRDNNQGYMRIRIDQFGVAELKTY